MPGVDCGVSGAEAGGKGKTLTFEKGIYPPACASSPLFILHLGDSPATFRLCPAEAARAGAREEDSPAAQPRRATREQRRRPQQGARCALLTPHCPPKKTRHGQSCRRCADRGSPSRRTGLIPPLAVWCAGSVACSRRALLQPGSWRCLREPGAAPQSSPPAGCRRLRAVPVSLCLQCQLRQPLPALPAAGVPGQIQLCAPTASRVLGTRGNAQTGRLQTPGQEPLRLQSRFCSQTP